MSSYHAPLRDMMFAMKEFGGNQVKSSERLGITRATLRKRLEILRGGGEKA